MQRDPRAFLWDVRESALAIQSFTSGLDTSTYAENTMAQAAVERKFEIIGEALSQLAKADATLAARIADLPQIVAFRNQLIHELCDGEREYGLEHYPKRSSRFDWHRSNFAARTSISFATLLAATPAYFKGPTSRFDPC